MCVVILPWFIKTAGQSFSPDFMSLDKNPHAWVDVQNSSIRSEWPPLWLPVREGRAKPSTFTKFLINAINIKHRNAQNIISFIMSHSFVKWSHFCKSHNITAILTLLQQASQPSVCLGDLSPHPALVLCYPSASDYRWSQEYLLTKRNTEVSIKININHVIPQQ